MRDGGGFVDIDTTLSVRQPELRVEIVEVTTGRRTLWKEIRPPDPSGVEQVGPIVIAPDGASYVYSYRRALDELYLATGMR